MATKHNLANINNISKLLDQGDFVGARRTLIQLTKKRLERENLVVLASLARRSGLPELGLKLLGPVVRPSGRKYVEATANEKAMYAACLIRIGAVLEAESLLDSIHVGLAPEKNLFLAFCKIVQWDYAASIPLLKQYLFQRNLTLYQRRMAEVNLLAAFVHEREEQNGSQLLQQLLENTRTEKFNVLFANCLELGAQHSIFMKDYAQADKYLKQARVQLQGSQSIDEFFVDKWSVIRLLLKERGSSQSRHLMKKLKLEAEKRGHWETVRDCDRYLALISRDESLFLRVYFGTPYAAFRRGLLIEAEERWKIPRYFDFIKNPNRLRPKIIDLFETENPLALKGGSLLQRLMSSLVSDFYRPRTLAALYAQVYPGEYYQVRSSPLRMHQALKRLREQMEKYQIPIQILEQSGSYRLEWGRGWGIRIFSDNPSTTRNEIQLNRLQTIMANRLFSTSEVCSILEISERSANRLMAFGVEEQKLTRSGLGKKTRFQFPP